MRRILFALFGLLMLVACTNDNQLQAHNNRTYVVFFTFGSVQLDNAAQKVISQASQYAAHFPGKKVYVEGFAAAYGDLSGDEMMAIQRAKTVANQVANNGINSSRIVQIPRPPETRKNPVAARRVEIEVK